MRIPVENGTQIKRFSKAKEKICGQPIPVTTETQIKKQINKPWTVPILIPNEKRRIGSKEMIRKTKKDRKEWNLKNREMESVATGNIGNIKTTSTDNSQNTNWSALEHGMDARIGKSNSLMRPSNTALSHPSASRLLSYAIEGCPANCGENWKLMAVCSY